MPIIVNGFGALRLCHSMVVPRKNQTSCRSMNASYFFRTKSKAASSSPSVDFKQFQYKAPISQSSIDRVDISPFSSRNEYLNLYGNLRIGVRGVTSGDPDLPNMSNWANWSIHCCFHSLSSCSMLKPVIVVGRNVARETLCGSQQSG